MHDEALQVVRELSAVGVALSAERDRNRLMERILRSACDLTTADGGTLYLAREGGRLGFEIVLTRSLGVHLGGTSAQPVHFQDIALYDTQGRPNERMVAARAALAGCTVRVADAYQDQEFDFSGTREFDRRTGYRSRSFLTVPMCDHERSLIGVLQLINALDAQGRVTEFSEEHALVAESLASQAAIALTNRRLIDEQRELFEAFIRLIAEAIDEKSPYTGGHCRRVPELTMMLADAAARCGQGELAQFRMSEADRYELHIASWLHDCGKVVTPEHVVDKATKLETIFDRIALVDTRFEVLKRDAEIARLNALLEDRAARAGREQEIETRYRRTLAQLDEERAFLRRCNQGSEHLPEADRARIARIARRRWMGPEGEERDLLSEEEVYNLGIERGTLTPEERGIINEHIVTTIRMLEALPYPKHLRRVPEFAGGHHERMDGRGYPRGLRREQMSVQARVMGIADIFEALTAADRPYKRAMTLSEALHILGRMSLDGHIDPDLFDVFVRDRVYLDYARRFLPLEQIDEVAHERIPGYRGDDRRGAVP